MSARFDLYKLDIFLHVARAGSFSHASEMLHLSQPAVSQHIHDLEASLGVKLFMRGRRGVTLTPEGVTLTDYASRILELIAEASNALTNVKGLSSAHLEIGTTPGVGTYLLPNWISGFHEQFPAVKMSLSTGSAHEIAEKLCARELDLGFVEGELSYADGQHLDTLDLCQVPQLLVVGQHHPLFARKKNVVLADLNGQEFVAPLPGSQPRLWLDAVLSESNVAPLFIAEFDTLEAIKRSVAAGTAASVLPKYAIQDEIAYALLRVLPLDVSLTRVLTAVWDKLTPLTSLAQTFMAYTDDCVHAELESSSNPSQTPPADRA
jgi:DNA-binding transcriptional LysR family regulator